MSFLLPSPSSRGRGLKFLQVIFCQHYKDVALFTRAWIEIDGSTPFEYVYTVALFTRAWIEMSER